MTVDMLRVQSRRDAAIAETARVSPSCLRGDIVGCEGRWAGAARIPCEVCTADGQKASQTWEPDPTVEDDERIRPRQLASGRGLGSRRASSGEERSIVQRQPATWCLSDIMLPGIDGFEVCRSIRRSSDVPIIIVTHAPIPRCRRRSKPARRHCKAVRPQRARLELRIVARGRSTDPNMPRASSANSRSRRRGSCARRRRAPLTKPITLARRAAKTRSGAVARSAARARVGLRLLGDGRSYDVPSVAYAPGRRRRRQPRHVVTVRESRYKLQGDGTGSLTTRRAARASRREGLSEGSRFRLLRRIAFQTAYHHVAPLEIVRSALLASATCT